MLTTLARKRLDYDPAMPIGTPVNILILDDSSFDRLRIRREVSRSGITAQIDEIACLCHLQDALDGKRYDVVIIDYFLPDGTGVEALDILLGHEVNRNAKPLLVSGNPWLNQESIRERVSSVTFLQKGKLGYGEILREFAMSQN